MTTPPTGRPSTPADATGLEPALAAVEQAIAELGHALTLNDAAPVEAAAGELQRAIRAAMDVFAQAVRRGAPPPALRRRFALAGGVIGAQREALLRAAGAVDQALDILIPRSSAGASVYSTQGGGGRGPGRVIAAS